MEELRSLNELFIKNVAPFTEWGHISFEANS